MFFFEWVVPILAVVAIGVVIFYLSVCSKPDAGVRSPGRTVVDKEDPGDLRD